MTSFVCRTCGLSWSEGPTRDHVDDAQCRHCAGSNQDNLIVTIDDLQARVAELEEARDLYLAALERIATHHTVEGETARSVLNIE